MNPDRYESYRQNKIESGLLYQDFVVDVVQQTIGIAIVQYASRHYQLHIGESRQGVEIKHDEIYATSGKLWIEFAEKARPRVGAFVPSGIMRADNTWLYVIGDYNTIFLFSKRLLKALHASKRYPQQVNKTGTSLGFLLPDAHARTFAELIFTPNASEKLAKGIRDLQLLGKELHRAAVENPAQASLFADLEHL